MTTWLDDIEARCEKATKGPWENEDHRGRGDWRSTGLIWARTREQSHPGEPICQVDCRRLGSLSDEQAITAFEANADFIAHSRTDNPILVARLRMAIEVLEEIASCDDEGHSYANQRAQDQRWAKAALDELERSPTEEKCEF